MKDKNGDECLDCNYNGGSVGLISKWVASDIIAFLKLERITLKANVKSCIPKFQRGAGARNADVHLNLIITEKEPETPEKRAKRLAAEEEARKKAKEERAQRRGKTQGRRST